MTQIDQLSQEIKFNILSSLNEIDLYNTAALNKSWRNTTLNYYCDKKFDEQIKTIEFIETIFSDITNFEKNLLTNLLDRDVYVMATSFSEIDTIAENVKSNLVDESRKVVDEANFSSYLVSLVDQYLSKKERGKAELISSLISDETKREEALFQMVKSDFNDGKLELAWTYFRVLTLKNEETINFLNLLFDEACRQMHFKIISDLISINYDLIFRVIDTYDLNNLFEFMMKVSKADENIFELMDFTILKHLGHGNFMGAGNLWMHHISLLSKDPNSFKLPKLIKIFIEEKQLALALYFISLIHDISLHDKMCHQLYIMLKERNLDSEASSVLNKIKTESNSQ